MPVKNRLEIPCDVIYSDLLMNMTGDRECRIENYKEILEFGDCCLKVSGKHYDLCIMGKKLEMITCQYHEITLKGRFESIQYDRK